MFVRMSNPVRVQLGIGNDFSKQCEKRESSTKPRLPVLFFCKYGGLGYQRYTSQLRLFFLGMPTTRSFWSDKKSCWSLCSTAINGERPSSSIASRGCKNRQAGNNLGCLEWSVVNCLSTVFVYVTYSIETGGVFFSSGCHRPRTVGERAGLLKVAREQGTGYCRLHTWKGTRT